MRVRIRKLKDKKCRQGLAPEQTKKKKKNEVTLFKTKFEHDTTGKLLPVNED